MRVGSCVLGACLAAIVTLFLVAHIIEAGSLLGRVPVPIALVEE